MTDQILSRAFIYDTLAMALQPPTMDTAGVLLSEKTKAALPRVAGWAIDADESGFPAAVAGWVQTFDTMTLAKLRAEHARLFGHTARGVVCPYETEFGQEGEFQQPRQLGKISGFYSAFGLSVRSQERERPDHVGCELEFMSFLSRKETYALEHADQEMLDETRKAFRLFLRDHLGRFGRAFGCLLAKADAQGFFGRAGCILYEFITIECRRLQLDAGPALLPLRSTADDGVPMACGSGDTP
jgi:TorA maturation chaperone TorD